ncbi:MAG: pilus assembly protein [Actinobacteria bacterium]|nr:pilus assembly protein [Actinomycetota bacterium]
MRNRDEHGSATLEASVLAPALLAIMLMIAVAGRIAIAHQSVDSAAAAGARAASISRTPTAANTDANTVVNATLANQGIACITLDITNDLTGFKTRVGEAASVTTTVSCTVSLADLTAAGIPGSVTLTGSASSPLDQFRERS